MLFSGSAVLGTSNAGGANGLGLDVCYSANGGALVGLPNYVLIAEPQNSAGLQSLTRFLGPLPVGTYTFGLCYYTSNPYWNANDWINNTAVVFY